MRPWRVAVLGLGHWYSAFGLARALPEYPKATLVAAAWHNPTQLAEFASAFGVDAYTDYDAVLAREDVDIVHIAAPVAEIPALAIRAARAGKHIILGKPMAMTVAEADAMVDAVHAAGVTCVAFQGLMRLRAGALKARIDSGEFGELAVLHQTSRWSIAEDWYQSGTPGWFVDPRAGARRRVHRRRDLLDRSVPLAGRQRDRDGRGEDRQPGAQGHRRRGLGHGDLHLRQRNPRDARGGVDHQRAARDRALAQTEQRRPARGGRDPRRVHRPVVPRPRPCGAVGRR